MLYIPSGTKYKRKDIIMIVSKQQVEEIHDGTEDTLGLLEACTGPLEIDKVYDKWDEHYGDGQYRYVVYVLMDSLKCDKFQFGELQFNYEPFYVGCGMNNRPKISAALARQLGDYTAKVDRMKRIVAAGGVVRTQIVGRFSTKKKAELVEKKLMNLIPHNFLTNGSYNFCEIPLVKEDYNCMSIHDSPELVITP